MKSARYPFVLALLSFGLMSCATQDKMREDIFNMQTRLIELERRVTNENEQTVSSRNDAHKKLASTSEQLEAINSDIRSVKGDVDSLKIAIKTGRMPGDDSGASIGDSLAEIASRVQALEATQVKMLTLLETKGKGGKNGKGDAKEKDSKHGTLNNLAGVKAAFAKNQFKHIIEDAPVIVGSLKGHDQYEVKFFLSESLFKLGKMREAALAYDDLLKAKGGNHKKDAHIRLRMGDCFRHLGDKDAAKVYYSELLEKYPNSEEATRAKEYLGRLKS